MASFSETCNESSGFSNLKFETLSTDEEMEIYPGTPRTEGLHG
jgi:hypothetical protein